MSVLFRRIGGRIVPILKGVARDVRNVSKAHRSVKPHQQSIKRFASEIKLRRREIAIRAANPVAGLEKSHALANQWSKTAASVARDMVRDNVGAIRKIQSGRRGLGVLGTLGGIGLVSGRKVVRKRGKRG